MDKIRLFGGPMDSVKIQNGDGRQIIVVVNGHLYQEAESGRIDEQGFRAFKYAGDK